MVIKSKERFIYINQNAVCGYKANEEINSFMKSGCKFTIYLEGKYNSYFIEQAFSNLNYSKEELFDKIEIITGNDLLDEIIFNIMNNNKVKTR